MLIPNGKGEFFYEDQKCTHYYAMVDKLYRVIEAFTTEDGTQYVVENYWPKMNDIEKHVCRQRGWDLEPYFTKEDHVPDRKIRRINCTIKQNKRLIVEEES